MSEETIVAIYDSAAQASAAAGDLVDAGIPPGAIIRHVRDGATPGGPAAPNRGPAFWAVLLGGGPGPVRDAVVLGRSVDAGSTVLAVRVPAARGPAVAGILERHGPVDIDERGARHGAARVPARFPARTLPPVIRGVAPSPAAAGTIGTAARSPGVGRRAADGGAARVRRYVVEDAAPPRDPGLSATGSLAGVAKGTASGA